MNLDEIFSREDVNRISKRLTEVRAKASKSGEMSDVANT
jgi:4-alpha-glucanotransferase